MLVLVTIPFLILENMPLAADFKSIHTSHFTVCFTQCMPDGYLKYTELCNLLQITAANHADKGGISFTDMQQANQAWVLSRMRIEIDKMPKWRDEISVTTWIISLENSRSVRALEVHIGGKKIISCETLWAVFNTLSRRPEELALPHQHFEKYGTRFATLERVSKITNNADLKTTGHHLVVLSDLDIVDHANHVKYLEWCLDCVEPAKIMQRELIAIDMNFLKELTLGDDVAIKANDSGVATVFAIQKQEKNCFLLRLEFTA